MSAQWSVFQQQSVAHPWWGWLLLLIAVIAHQSASAKDSKVVTVVPEQKSAEVSITTSQELLVRLPGQPGTGFSWQLLSTPALLKLESHSTEAPDKSQPGAWQMQAFRFQSNTAGSETLQFGYRRPWEKDAPPAKTFSLVVIVTRSN